MEVTFMLCLFYRAAHNLCTFYLVHLVTHAASSDCAYCVGNTKVEEDLDVPAQKREVNVKTEKDTGSEEDECIGIKDEENIYSEQEEKEDKDIDAKQEASLEDTV
jgi:hypothetical protein